jgi:hypothetical protein
MKACLMNLQFATTISPKANLTYAEARLASINLLVDSKFGPKRVAADFQKTDLSNQFSRKIPIRQGTSGS